MKRLVCAAALAAFALVSSAETQFLQQSAAAGAQWRGRKVAFLGDSISAGVGTKKGYWKFVEETLGVEQHVYAVSGHRWSDMMARIADMQKELGSDIDAIVVFIGTNDFGSGVPVGEWWTTNAIDTVFHGTPGKRIVRTPNVDVKTTRGAINVTLRYLKENWPDAQIILTTPVHRGIFAKSWRPKDQHQPDELHSNMLGLFVDDYVRVNREAADIWSCPLIDFFRDCGITPLVPSHGKYMNAPDWDRLHPNATGHQRMAALICSRLAALPVLRP